MKYLLIIVAAVSMIVSCQSADKKAEPALTQEEKEKALSDSANFTKIQWLDSTVQDLGKIKEGQVVEVTYHFKNIGEKPLIISDVSASCGCTVPEKPEKAFAPGEEGVIKAKFDSGGQHHGEARKTVYVNANTNPQMTYLSFNLEVTD